MSILYLGPSDDELVRTDKITFRPGGPPGDGVVTSWLDVKRFVALKHGRCIVELDDSLESPLRVPARSGTTDGFGKLEIRLAPERRGSRPLRLVVADGAMLANIFKLAGLLEIVGE